jgi:hypothetical protein
VLDAELVEPAVELYVLNEVARLLPRALLHHEKQPRPTLVAEHDPDSNPCIIAHGED